VQSQLNHPYLLIYLTIIYILVGCDAGENWFIEILYTLKETCAHCGGKAGNPLPPRFSPLDPYGKYRRIVRSRDINAREQGSSSGKEC